MKKGFFSVIGALLLTSAVASAVNPKVIAHRGYWKTEGSAQNSIRSLVKADSIGCYATEFDVWLTKDNVAVVNHDRDINGIVIEESNYDDIKDQKLSNGETIPTLDDYLDAAAGLSIRLVCELKAHDSRSRERRAVQDIFGKIEKYGLAERTDYITFSPYAFKEFIAGAPSCAEVYYLEGDYVPEQLKFAKSAGLDYSIGVMRAHPEWIEEAHEKGLKVNVWTVDKPEDMQWCIDHNVDFITTNLPEELMNLLMD